MKVNTSFIFLWILGFFFLSSCKKSTNTKEYDSSVEHTLSNISYGNKAKQKMDIYLPAERSDSTTKVFVLIHGGGWAAGDKSEMKDVFNNLKSTYPHHAVINLNYRLGTVGSPGYPKQINDIEKAIKEIQKSKYDVMNQYLLYGVSAGGHLSLLYGYAFDPNNEVKGICNVVGPSDLTDASFLNSQLAQDVFIPALIGSVNEPEKTELLKEVSPAKHVTSSVPPTISFYGDADPLVPQTQLPLLHNQLDSCGVYNQATLFHGNTHGPWETAWYNELAFKWAQFIDVYFK